MQDVYYYFTVVEAVLKSNSQSNGNGQISTLCGSKAPEWILMKGSMHIAFQKRASFYFLNNSFKIN